MNVPKSDTASLAGEARVNKAIQAPKTTPAPKPNPLLESAQAIAARGWGVVALHTPVQTGPKAVCSCSKLHHCRNIGKHPRWHKKTLPSGAHSATTNAATIREWWRRWPDANVGIAVGPAWGLVVIDIDPRNGGSDTFDELLRTMGPLPVTVEAITGGGGRHLLFRHPGGDIAGTLGSGVDVLGSDGKLIVGSGSLHPSGRRYSWELSHEPGIVALAELPEAWLLRLKGMGNSGDRDDGEDRETGTQPPNPTSIVPVVPVVSVDPIDPVIPIPPGRANGQWTEQRVLERALPTGRGQHDRCTLILARGARFHLGYASPDAAGGLFERWWDQARRHCAEQDADVAWCKFERAFHAARFALDAHDLAARAFDAARREPLPKVAHQFRGPRVQLLVGIVHQMHHFAGGSFRLSCHQIAALLGAKPNDAWEWLRSLERRKVVRCLDPGRPGSAGRRAATFEYIGGWDACTGGSSAVDSGNGTKSRDSNGAPPGGDARQ